MLIRILFSLLILTSIVSSKQPTILTFLAQYQDEQEQDYIQLTLSVKAQGTSLVKSMQQAYKIAQQVKQVSIQFCLTHTKKKSDCKDIVEIGNYEIEPKYQIIKRQSKFIGFEVQHKVSIKVLAVDFISDLADQILKQKNTKILQFEWKPLKQVNNEEASVKQGTQQGEELCDQLGMHLNKINNVQEVNQTQENVAIYKFVVECLPGRVQSADNKKDAKSQKTKSQKEDHHNDDNESQPDKKDKKKQNDKKKKPSKQTNEDL